MNYVTQTIDRVYTYVYKYVAKVNIPKHSTTDELYFTLIFCHTHRPHVLHLHCIHAKYASVCEIWLMKPPTLLSPIVDVVLKSRQMEYNLKNVQVCRP